MASLIRFGREGIERREGRSSFVFGEVESTA